MIKVRLMGLPGEVASFADAFERAGMFFERSQEYANRGGSRYVRAYLEVEAPSAGEDKSGRRLPRDRD